MAIDSSLLSERNISNISILDMYSVYGITRHVPKTYLEQIGWMAHDEKTGDFVSVKYNRYFDITPIRDNQECFVRPVIEFWKPIDSKYCGQKVSILGKEWTLTENKNGVVALCSEVIGKSKPIELLMFMAEWYKETKIKMELEKGNETSLADDVLNGNTVENIGNTNVIEGNFHDELDVAI